MKTPRLFLAALCVAVIVSASGCAHDERKGDPEIVDLEIKGAKSVKPSAIEDKILSAETSWIPFSRKERFDENAWRTDQKRIERYYREQGYYQAKVLAAEVVPKKKGAVALSVEVDEGNPTTLSEVRVEGLEGLPANHREELEEEIPFEQGDVFVEDTWEQLEAGLEEMLREQGYALADVQSQATVDLVTERAVADVKLLPGPRYKFGDVRVKTHQGRVVDDWRVIEQAKEAIEDEDWYSESGREEAQARIFKMGVFGAAKVEVGQARPENGTVDLDVELQEAAFHSVRGGFGFGIDQARNDVHAIGEYVDRNFLGGLRKLELEARAGWAFLPNAYTVARNNGDRVTKNGPIALLSADVHQPRLFHPNFTGNGKMELERALEPAYSFNGARAEVGSSWTPWTWLSVTPSYHVELYQLESGEARLGGSSPALLFGCPTNCVLSYLEQTVELDRRDDKQEPKNGYLLSFAIQEGGGFLSGSFDYLRLLPEARGYVSVLDDDRLTFAGRVRAGSLIPLSGGALDTPIVARFFSGGNSMRGFSTRRLSPMLVVRNDGTGTNEAEPLPIGGNGLFETQLEARYGFTQTLVGALFTDLGFVTTEKLEAAAVQNNLQLAVGGGIRYRTPAGPIRLDLAYRPDVGPPLQVYQQENESFTYRQSQGCFGFGSGNAAAGGAPEGPCALHLSIGEAF